jgi:NAD(P)-dependent dehydrogenase (short-subunit alcohol dehydrogenase family)
MTLPIARDLSQHGIRVNTIAPGIMDTPMLAGLPEPARVSLGQQVLYPQRLGTPEEYAALAHFLLTHGYMNAETVRMDGGIRMAPR